jgi:hypothetical protein
MRDDLNEFTREAPELTLEKFWFERFEDGK